MSKEKSLKLLEFLDKERALNGFLRNVEESAKRGECYYDAKKYPKTIIFRVLLPDGTLASCFDWNETPEGAEYWKGLNDKFEGVG